MKNKFKLLVILFLLVLSFNKIDALEKINEVRLTSSINSVSEGVLPNSYTITTTTPHVSIVDDNIYWMYWCKKCTAWLGFGKETPTAVDDGITHYGMRVSMHLDAEYELDDDVRIILNGNDITNFGHTMKNNVGSGVFIDFGTAGDELPRYTVHYDLGGGTSDKIEDEVVIAGDDITLPAYRNVNNPQGQIIKNWKIDGTDYVQHDHYIPTKNTTVYAVYETDNYIRDSRVKLTPSTIDDSISPNDLVFTPEGPEQDHYTVSLYRVYDLTDKTQNTTEQYNYYPHDKKFIANHEYAIEFSFNAINGYQYDETQSNRSSTFKLNDDYTDIAGYSSLSGCKDRRVVLTANKNNEISNVKISITTPTVDGSLYNAPVIIFPNKVRVYAYDWYENGNWMSKNYDKFEEGHTYELRVNVAASVSDAFINTTATINGNPAEVHKRFDDNMNITFKYSFTVPMVPRINAITSNASVPSIGVPLDEPPIISTPKVNLYAYDWYEDGIRMSKSFDSFRKGHKYTLKVRATTTDKFSDDIVVSINGKTATIEEITNDKRQILYSVEYELLDDCIVTFNSMGGNTIPDRTLPMDSFLGELPIPTKENNNFLGWYLDTNYQTRVTDTTLVNASFTLYAKWELKQTNNTDPSNTQNIEVNELTASDIQITPSIDNTAVIVLDKYYSNQKYTLYKSTNKKKWTKVAVLNNNTYTVKGIVYGQKTYYRLTIELNKKKVNSNIVDIKINPNVVTNLKIESAGSANIKISYDKANYTGYEIQRSTKPDSGFKKVTYITKSKTTTYNNKKLKNATTYYYRVRAYKKVKSKKVYGPWSNIVSATTGPKAPSKLTLKDIDYQTISIDIKESKTTSYYVIQRSTNKKKYFTTIATTMDLNYLDNVLTGTKYYYRVKACNTNNVCSGYSKVYDKKTKLNPSSITVSSQEELKVTLSLTSVDGSVGYEVYRSTKKNKGFKSILDTTNLIIDDINIKSGKTYYYKVRAYKTINNKKVYSAYSKVIKVKTI